MQLAHTLQSAVLISSVLAMTMTPGVAHAEPFTAKVDDLDHGRFSNEHAYNGFGCHGDNVSPPISWSRPPANAKSIVVTIYDPDAPTGGLGWTHWEVVNIPASQSSLEKGASGNAALLPMGAVETLTDFGESKYGGPCPPKGTSHRYTVTVSALDVPHIEVGKKSSPALVAYQMHGKVIAQARYVAKYRRAAN